VVEKILLNALSGQGTKHPYPEEFPMQLVIASYCNLERQSQVASLKRISTEFLGGSFKSICALHFENTTVLHLQSYAILQFCSEINWVVAATGYSPIYDSDSIMKVFGNNLLE